MNSREHAASILKSTDEVKARTLEMVVRHLDTVTRSEERRREKTRAGIALRNIAKWAAVCSAGNIECTSGQGCDGCMDLSGKWDTAKFIDGKWIHKREGQDG